MEVEIDLNSEKFNIEEFMEICDALSCEKRIQILKIIKKNSSLKQGELCKLMDLSAGDISFHIGKLKKAGLITVNIGKGLLEKRTKVPNLRISKVSIIL
jgi:predicted transcriptional regulator